MLSIRIFDREAGEFKDFEFDPKQVTEFGIRNNQVYTNKGTFKKWNKKAYIEIGNQRYHTYNINIINELKEVLKGKYSTHKDNQVEYKDYSEKKATDWTYKIINE